MKRLLVSCYYDGMTVSEAVSFIQRCYWETPTARQVSAAQAEIKDCLGIDWA